MGSKTVSWVEKACWPVRTETPVSVLSGSWQPYPHWAPEDQLEGRGRSLPGAGEARLLGSTVPSPEKKKSRQKDRKKTVTTSIINHTNIGQHRVIVQKS